MDIESSAIVLSDVPVNPRMRVAKPRQEDDACAAFRRQRILSELPECHMADTKNELRLSLPHGIPLSPYDWQSDTI
jgi:hypothetical protein